VWTVERLELTMEERAELERRVRGRTTSHRDRVRVEVILLCADGIPGTKVAPRVGLSKQAVCKWQRRFLELGLDGLVDAPRSGRPLVYGPTERLLLMAKMTEGHPVVDSQWSHSELHMAMAASGVGISTSQIGRILAADDVKPHRVDGWLRGGTRRSSRSGPRTRL